MVLNSIRKAALASAVLLLLGSSESTGSGPRRVSAVGLQAKEREFAGLAPEADSVLLQTES